MIPAARPTRLKGERPCSTCGLCEKDDFTFFFVHCCICDRFWHNDCLYTRVSRNEILLRNKKDISARGLGWIDWKCRQCRGLGPEGRQHRKRGHYIDLTLDGDDEIEVLSSVPTGPPATQASLPAPPPGPLPPQSQVPHRPPSPEIIDLNADDDEEDDIIQISSAIHRAPPQVGVIPEPVHPIEPPDVPTQDQPMLDLNDLSLEEHPPSPPPPEFPPFAKCIDVIEHRFGPMDGTRRPGISLPPALRGYGRTVLGQRMQDIFTSDKLVQSIGLKGLKAVGWRVEKRERIASVEPPIIPDWARTANAKGKGRDPGERRPRPVTEFRLVPPRLRTTEIKSGSESYPPRKPRKSTVAVHRDSTVKLEPIDLCFS